MEVLKQESLDLWLANPVFAAAGREECARLASECPTERYGDGREIVSAREPMDDVIVLLEGRARVFHRSADGREALTRLVQAPMLLGDAEVLSGVSCLENVAAAGEVLVAFVPAEEFCDLLERSRPAMAAHLRHLAASSCVRTRDGRQVFAMLEQRAGNLLLTLAEQHGQRTPDGEPLTPALSLNDLARSLGTIRRTVTKTINGLTRKGMIRRFGGGFVLLRPDALEAETSSIRHGLFYRMGMPLERIEQDEREAELEIEVLEPGSAAGTRRIVRDELVIGQEPYCKLRLLDRLVSRRHCRIHRTAGSRFWVVDLDSDTGTFVDGKRVCRKLLHGDELIQVGDTQLRVRVLHERDNERDSDALDIPQTHAAVG